MNKNNIRLTRTACKIAAKNGVTAEVINDTFATGEVKAHEIEGQTVVRKGKVALIGVEKDADTFLVITMRTGHKVEKF